MKHRVRITVTDDNGEKHYYESKESVKVFFYQAAIQHTSDDFERAKTIAEIGYNLCARNPLHSPMGMVASFLLHLDEKSFALYKKMNTEDQAFLFAQFLKEYVLNNDEEDEEIEEDMEKSPNIKYMA